MKIKREAREDERRKLVTLDIEEVDVPIGVSKMDDALACLEHTRPAVVKQYLENGRLVLRVLVHIDVFGIECELKEYNDMVVDAEMSDEGQDEAIHEERIVDDSRQPCSYSAELKVIYLWNHS